MGKTFFGIVACFCLASLPNAGQVFAAQTVTSPGPAASPQPPQPATSPQPAASPQLPVDVRILISVPDQKLAVLVNSKPYKTFRISTSRYGEGDSQGSWRTPLGHLVVATKIGGAAPSGAVFNGRHLTGEILSVNAPGRDPIVSRIIWLRGREFGNRNAYQRCIYIHGTPQEEFLGKKSSFGCIRMSSEDVIQVFQWVQTGTDVIVVDKPLNRAVKESAEGNLVAKTGRLNEQGGAVRSFVYSR
jgi:lipoprotein-anchoring transpeptidase ErfK/SrfK